MKHDYYYYKKEELLKNPKIPLIVMEDNATIFKSMAEEMVEEIRERMHSVKLLFLFVRLDQWDSIHIL